jgi:hypothetical protein
MRKIITHVLCAVALAALGMFVLIEWPKETIPLIIGVVLVVGALIVAFKAPMHEIVVWVDGNAPVLTRSLGGLVRLGRRESDAVAVVPPVAPPAVADPPVDGGGA